MRNTKATKTTTPTRTASKTTKSATKTATKTKTLKTTAKPVAKAVPKVATKTTRATAKPTVTKSKASFKSVAKKPTCTPEQRYHMVCEAAYYIAERNGFNTDLQYQGWLEAERQIDEEYTTTNS